MSKAKDAKRTFVDLARIRVIAGKGGDGMVHFRREAFVPRGGPDGGDGGDGGSVYLVGDRSLKTLFDFRYNRIFRAEDGKPGGPQKKHGRKGKDVIIRVPLGTVVYDDITGELIGEITEHGQKLLVAKGGKGGRGNARFATPQRRAPRIAEPGTEGQERWLRLELKLLGDVGLIGFPNSGKTTLLKALAGSSGKIANYPFTTVTPNLGMVKDDFSISFAVVDIPGIIEGAHQGRGMGLAFLRHIQRTLLLVFVLDATDSPLDHYRKLKSELEAFDPTLLEKPKIVVLNKIDLIENGEVDFSIDEDVEVYKVSALLGWGVLELKEGIKRWVVKLRQQDLQSAQR